MEIDKPKYVKTRKYDPIVNKESLKRISISDNEEYEYTSMHQDPNVRFSTWATLCRSSLKILLSFSKYYSFPKSKSKSKQSIAVTSDATFMMRISLHHPTIYNILM